MPLSPDARRWLAPLAALLTALAAAILTLPRPQPPAADSAEVAFARMMIPHHAQAVEMAALVRSRAPGRSVRSLAQDIALTQGEQIRTMRGWLTLWGHAEGTASSPKISAGAAAAMGMASPAELRTLSTLPLPQAEVHFLRLMIRHHRGALAMLPPVLSPHTRPEVLRLARQISASQSGEIATMTGVLRRAASADIEPASPAGHSHR